MAKTGRGRRQVHSSKKMVVICILAVVLGMSYWNRETLLRLLRLLGQEPIPDHCTIHEASKASPYTPYLCIIVMLLTALAAQRLKRVEKARSITLLRGNRKLHKEGDLVTP